MMEKYGVENEKLPPTKEQWDEINFLYRNGCEFKLPKSRQEAEDILEKFAKKGD